MKYVTLILVVVSFLQCDSARQSQNPNSNASFNTLYQSSYGGKDVQTYSVVRTKSEMTKELATLNLDQNVFNRLKSFDLSNKMVLFLHMGTHNTGGYNIGVANVEVKGETSFITLDKKSPNPDEPVTMALTNPYCIVIIDANKHVVFR